MGLTGINLPKNKLTKHRMFSSAVPPQRQKKIFSFLFVLPSGLSLRVEDCVLCERYGRSSYLILQIIKRCPLVHFSS